MLSMTRLPCSYSFLRNLGWGQFFSIFDNFDEEHRHELRFGQIALKLGTLESYSKSAVNAIPAFLMPSKNEISTAKSLSSASHL
jgi:hypothetical protein